MLPHPREFFLNLDGGSYTDNRAAPIVVDASLSWRTSMAARTTGGNKAWSAPFTTLRRRPLIIGRSAPSARGAARRTGTRAFDPKSLTRDAIPCAAMLRAFNGLVESLFVTRGQRACPACVRRSHGPCWRAWVAAYTLFTFLWPALGPLPRVITGAVERSAHAAQHKHAHAVAVHVDCDHPVDVPGTPLHPADHDCAPCLVFKCLAHFAIALQPLCRAPMLVAAVSLPCSEAQVAVAITVSPPQPARGPPARLCLNGVFST